MVNMGELFAYPRIRNIPMDLVPINEKEHHYLLQVGDLLFARQSLVLSGAGQCSIFLGNVAPTVFESHLIRCRLNPIRSNPLFYFYFFRSPDGRRAIEAIVEQGAGASGIRGSDLVNVQVPNPPKQIQDEVAALLGALDDRITLLRETNTTLEAIAQALFKSWFVDFDPVHAKMQGRAPEGMDEVTATLFPDSFEESELGAVPKGWTFGSLSDLCVIASGKRPADRSDLPSGNRNIPLYGGAGLMGYTSESLFEEKKIVTGRVGTLGRVHIAYPPCWASDNVLVLSPRDETFFSFSFQWLCVIDVHALNRGSTQPLLTQKDLGAQMAVTPPRTLLEKFEEISAALNEQTRLQTLQIETLVNLRDTLLPRLISGELRASSIAGDAA